MVRLLRSFVLVLVLLAAPALAKDGDSRYAGLDGFLIHYKSWGKADAPPVIMVHGFTLDMTLWHNQVPVLAKTHRVITLDSPGHGQSGRPGNVDYTMDLYARAVEAVAKDAGVSHAVLVGHSMGLPVIHTVARRGVLPIDKVVFVDGAIMAPHPDPKERAAQEAFMAEMQATLNGPDFRQGLAQLYRGIMVKVPAAEGKALLGKLGNADQHVVSSTFSHFTDPAVWAPARYEFPVLGLYAKMSSKGVEEWLAANYPRHTLKVWDDVDHFPQLDRPKRVNREMVRFLR